MYVRIKMFNVWRVSRRQLSWPRIVRASFHHHYHHQHDDEMMPCLFYQKKFIFWQKRHLASFQLFKKGRASPKRQGITKKGQGAAPCKNGLGRTLIMTLRNWLNNMHNLWKSASKEYKLKVRRTFSSATYWCEPWVLLTFYVKWIKAFDTKCYRKILPIPWITQLTAQSLQY